MLTTGAGLGGQRSASDKKRVYILSRFGPLPGPEERGYGMVRRTLIPTGSVTAGRFRRTEFRSFWYTLLDYRYRRLCLRKPDRTQLPRIVRALVSVRHVQSDPAGPRNAQPRRE